MARLVLWVLVLCTVGSLARPDKQDVQDVYISKFIKLLQHLNEPLPSELQKDAASYESIKDHLDKFKNATAANTYHVMLEEGWLLPRGKPFSIDEPAHVFEALTLFNALSSAKDFKTLYETAAYLRSKINEGIFVYTLFTIIIYNRNSEVAIHLNPIYEIFPNYFHNAETMNIIQKISGYGTQITQINDKTFLLENDKIVINASSTYWPYVNDKNFALSYFTNDIRQLSEFYIRTVAMPNWVYFKQSEPQSVDMRRHRGSSFWSTYRQVVARYYMERLSNGLGEIPDITNVIEDGFNPGLLHFNGVPLPSRPDNYRLDQPHLAGVLEKAFEFENRIWEAIDQGFYRNSQGEKVSLLSKDGLNDLGNLIESNVNSPNRKYYKDFIRLWKQILGNTVKSNYEYENRFTPLTLPSALEMPQTAFRDPAFHMIYKRVLKLFVHWQKQMPLYKPEELQFPGVEILNIETDKLVTYFETVLVNATQGLYRQIDGNRAKNKFPEVFVKYEQLTNKPFSIKIKIRSQKEEYVTLKLFLAPKYDSKGLEIPLHQNTENFYIISTSFFTLPAGEEVITKEFSYDDYETIQGFKLYNDLESSRHITFLPKGNAGGQVFQLIAYIQQDDVDSQHDLFFPSDRPLHSYQLLNVPNFKIADVKIYHEE